MPFRTSTFLIFASFPLATLLLSGCRTKVNSETSERASATSKGAKVTPGGAESNIATGDQAQLVQKLEALGCSCQENPQGPVRFVGINSKATSESFKLLRELKSTEGVTMIGMIPLTNEGLSYLKDLPKLRSLVLPTNDNSDKFLTAVKDFPALTSLKVDDGVTDEGLKNLVHLINLEELTIGRSKITDAGLDELAALTHLRSLQISSSQVSLTDVKNLKVLANLEVLKLTNSKLSDSGIKRLIDHLSNQVGPMKLRELDISATQVTDAHMKDLKCFSELTDLKLGENSITDLGIKQLASLGKLRSLWINETKTTDAGVADFKTVCPKVNVVR